MDNTIEKLMELIEKIVNEPGKTWSEKKQYILNGCSDSDKINVTEFCSWFSEE